QYRGVVIAAFKNVADSLTALQNDAVALQKAVDFERSAAKALEITRRRLQLGDISYLEVLTAQQNYQQELLVLVVAQSNRPRIPQHCFRRWAGAGGTATMSSHRNQQLSFPAG